MNRKEMVKKLGEFFGVKPKYLNAPTFAYEIEMPEETYTIDRQRTITTSVGEVKTFEEITNPLEPKEEPEEEIEQPAEEKHEPLEIDGLEITLPLEGHSGTTLRNRSPGRIRQSGCIHRGYWS